MNMVEDILWAFLPTYRLCRVLGFASYTIKDPSHSIRIVYSKTYAFLTTILLSADIVYSTWYYTLSISRLKPSPILTSVGAMYLFSEMVHVVVNVVLNRIHTKKTIAMLNRLYSIERDFMKLGIQSDYKGLRLRCFLPWLWEFSVLNLAQWFFFFVTYTNQSFGYLILFVLRVYLYLLQSVVDGQFIAFFTIMAEMFRKHNAYTAFRFLDNTYIRKRKAFRIVTLADTEILKKLAMLHQQLCQLSRTCNEVLTIQILFTFFMYLSLMLLQLFEATTVLTKITGQPMSVISTIMTSIKILIYVVISSQCMKESDRIKTILFKIAAETCESDLRKEVKAFSLQIFHERFQITAGGFFVLNYGFVLAVFEALCVYTIIIRQFGTALSVYDVLSRKGAA